MMTEQKSYFPFLYFNSFWQKSMELVQTESGKIIAINGCQRS